MRNIESASEEAYVRKFAFRKFEGLRKGRLYRVWSVATYNMKHQWSRSRWLKILFGFIIFMFVMMNMFILMFASILAEMQTTSPNEFLADNLWGLVRGFVDIAGGGEVEIGDDEMPASMSIGGISIFLLVCVVIMGSGLVADDIRYKATEIYYSKLDKVEYITAKYLAFFLFGNIIFTLPCVIEWVLLVTGIKGVDFLEALPVLAGVVIFCNSVILVYGSISVAISSLTNKRLYAGLMMFFGIIMVSGWLVPTLVPRREFSPFIYADILTVLLIFSYMLTGDSSISFRIGFDSVPVDMDLATLEGWLIPLVIILYILAGLAVFAYQVMWRHSRQ
ncbi:MAG: hypothetical protein ACFFD4_11195 [Candidatus Odinarchaeota archaeon]